MLFDERGDGDYRIYAGALEAPRGHGYIAATQWHPEFHKYGSTETLDDTPILHDFLWACATARVAPRTAMREMPGRIRNRAARLLRQALLRR